MTGYKDPPENTQYKKGQSGNPAGKKPGERRLATIMKEMMDVEIPYKDLENKSTKMRVDQALIMALLARALYKQDTRAMDILLDRIDGKLENTTTLIHEAPDTSAILEKIVEKFAKKGAKKKAK